VNASEWGSLNAVGMSRLDWDGSEVRVGRSSTKLDRVGQMVSHSARCCSNLVVSTEP